MDSFSNALFLYEINRFGILATDAGNAYLIGYSKQKIYKIVGNNFGDELEGRIIIIVRDLYGLKTRMAIWNEYIFSDTLNFIGFRPSKEDTYL